MKNGKERIIYNNYDLWEDYEEEIREFLKEEYEEENPTDNDIWDEIYFEDNVTWEAEEANLENFFSENLAGYIIFGSVGRWNGKFDGGEVFDDWQDLVQRVNPWKDCDYLKIYDINGHLYIKCSHHDGTNFYEIKELTETGREFYENWECYNTEKDYTEREIVNLITGSNFYSRLPHFANKVYGCKRKEYATENV